MNRQDLHHKPIENPHLSIKNSASEEIARQMAEYEAKNGKVETTPIIIRDKKYLSDQAQKELMGTKTKIDERRKRADKGSSKSAKIKGLGDMRVGSKKTF